MNHRQAILKMPDRLKHNNIVHVHGVGKVPCLNLKLFK